MNLIDSFEGVPDEDDGLLYSIEHWDKAKIDSRDASHTSREVEAFVHPRTATGARILKSDDGKYSVQPSMGDYDNGDCVAQPDDPNLFVSGGSTVITHKLDTIEEARAIAYAWLHGWVMRNSSIGDDEGDVLDADEFREAKQIN